MALNFGGFGDTFPGPFGVMGNGQMSPAFLQAMQASKGQLAKPATPPAPPAPPQIAPGTFEQQLMSQGAYNTPPAQTQNPWLQGQQGINPQLQGMLANLPPRPTGLPPGLLSRPMGVVDTPRYGANAPQPQLPPGLLTALQRQRQFDRSGRRGDVNGRQGWGGPADHADRAHSGVGNNGAQDRGYDRSMGDRTGGL